jgi:CHAD domain-containing protein
MRIMSKQASKQASRQNVNRARLLEYVDQLVEKLRTMVPRAIKDGDETAIHHARVATRRLKAAVDVFDSVTSKSHRNELTKILSKLRKNLGPARDLDVMIGHLKEMKADRLKPGVGWMIEHLTRKQTESKQAASEEIDVAKVMARLGAWWGVRQEWVEAGEQLNALMGESLHLQLEEFIGHADAIAGRAGAKTDAQMLDPHELRIAGKALRYTLELAIGGGHPLPAAVSKTFKRMQDALGIWHDNVVLTDCALKLSLKNLISHHDAAVQRSVLDVAKVAMQKSQRELSKFGKLWNAKGESLAATIRRAFPLVIPETVTDAITDLSSDAVTESKADPDPSGSAPSAEHPAQATAANEPSAA